MRGVVTAVVLCAGVLIGCGGGDEQAEPTTVPSPTSPGTSSHPGATVSPTTGPSTAPPTTSTTITSTTTTTTTTSTTTTTTTTSTTTTTTTTSTLPPPRSATLLFTGDLIPHSPVVRAAERMAVEAGGSRSHDFRPLFADVAGRIAAADLAFCHLETPLTDDLTAMSGYPRFNGPAGLADDLVDIGYDVCSTASNHALDKGWMGVLSTLAILEAAGIPQSGMAASESDASEPLLLDAGGITVGFVSATYGTNGMPRPEAAPWIVADLDLDLLLDSARRSREVGAEFVVIGLHWGIEYRTSPTATQREQAETLLADPDVDLVVGHHAHVVQPVGMVGEEFVVFGLGNFLTNQSASCCAVGAQDGVIVEVELQEVRGPDGDSTVIARGVSVTPTRVDRADGHRIVDVPAAIAASVAADEAPDADLVASWYRTAERILAEELPEGLLRVQMGEG